MCLNHPYEHYIILIFFKSASLLSLLLFNDASLLSLIISKDASLLSLLNYTCSEGNCILFINFTLFPCITVSWLQCYADNLTICNFSVSPLAADCSVTMRHYSITG